MLSKMAMMDESDESDSEDLNLIGSIQNAFNTPVVDECLQILSGTSDVSDSSNVHTPHSTRGRQSGTNLPMRSFNNTTPRQTSNLTPRILSKYGADTTPQQSETADVSDSFDATPPHYTQGRQSGTNVSMRSFNNTTPQQTPFHGQRLSFGGKCPRREVVEDTYGCSSCKVLKQELQELKRESLLDTKHIVSNDCSPMKIYNWRWGTYSASLQKKCNVVTLQNTCACRTPVVSA